MKKLQINIYLIFKFCLGIAILKSIDLKILIIHPIRLIQNLKMYIKYILILLKFSFIVF